MNLPTSTTGLWLWLPIAMVVAGNIAYHVGLKGMSTEIHPLSPLVVLFTTSAVATLVLRLVTGREAGLREEIAIAGWRPFAVGISIVAIELGFLLAYRAGWKISAAVVTANILVAIALLAVGALAFREPVTLPRLAGIATCLAGLWLVSRG
ncbi:MAG: hypothetical protein ABIU84_16305 [Thermoanaerobaculia bacterium]